MPPRSMMPPTPAKLSTKKLSKKASKKPMEASKKIRAPKTFPDTRMIYISDEDDDDVVFTAVENEDGGIVINGSRLGKKKKN